MILFFLTICFLPPRETDMFNYAYILDCVEKDTLLPNLLDYRCVIGCTDGWMAQYPFSSSNRGCLEQCGGSGSALIRIELKGRIRIRIRSKVISWIRFRINLRMKSPNVWNIWANKSTFSRLWAFIWKLGSGSASKWKGRIRIRSKGRSGIRIILKGRIRISINLRMKSQNVWNMSTFQGFEPLFGSWDPDTHQSEKVGSGSAAKGEAGSGSGSASKCLAGYGSTSTWCGSATQACRVEFIYLN